MNRFGVKINDHFGKTGVLACLGKQASSLFLRLPSVLTRQTLGRQASSPVSANRLPACFFTCHPF
jgi:hypothetical protein